MTLLRRALDIAGIVVLGALLAVFFVATAPLWLLYITLDNWKERTR